MKENMMTTNFEHQERVIFIQSTKIGTHENKANHSTVQMTFAPVRTPGGLSPEYVLHIPSMS